MIRWLLPLLLAFGAIPAQAQAQAGNHQAALVVVDGSGAVETVCVPFDSERTSGYELLQRAGMDLVVETSGMGTAVCSINGYGCAANDCFCRCRGSNCEYWSYWQRQEDQWQYAAVGAHLLTVQNGTVQGWIWGPGTVTEASPPPDLRFADICTSLEPTPEILAEPVTAVSWPSYAGFALILLVLGGLLLHARQRQSKEKIRT